MAFSRLFPNGSENQQIGLDSIVTNSHNKPLNEIIDIRKGNGSATLFNTLHDLRFSYFE